MIDPIRKVVIVGGGPEAWLAALTLQRVLAPQNVAITVIETRGNGGASASMPSLSLLHRALGIGEADFMRSSGATFKLGTKFEGWSGEGSCYFHPYGQTGGAFEGIPFHQVWLKHRPVPLSDFALASLAAGASRFAFPSADPRSVLSTLDYAYHFEATRYRDFLRARAARQGVTVLSGEIDDVVQEAAFVHAVSLKNGKRIEADLFIDCSTDGVVMDALNGRFDDWSHLFPCDRILHVSCEDNESPAPYTQCSAKGVGWTWRIPLQGRTGYGYVYASRYTSDDTARAEIAKWLGGKALAEPTVASLRPGRRTEFWRGNVIAVGPAAGNLEPLAWMDLHLAQSALLRLTTLLPERGCGSAEAIEFNRLTASEWDRARDFVLLHYAIASRDDTPFWRDARARELPDLLRRKIEMFRNRGHVIQYDDEVIDGAGWAAAFLGQGVVPRRIDPLVERIEDAHIARELDRMRALFLQVVDSMSSHAAMLERTGALERKSR